VKATDLPLSIIIVGIGNEEFENMDILDADDKPLISSKGVKMKR
jgi:copine 5/8/9